MITYVTFGQIHVHKINGKTFDNNCIAKVNGGMKEVRELFGKEYSSMYSLEHLTPQMMSYFPRGVIKV